MDLDSAGNPPKRTRSKIKQTAADDIPAKTSGSRSRKSKAIEVTAITAVPTPDDNELLGMIALAAYFLAEQRNFEPGHEMDDWLEAERQIRALYS
jgi:hypothetical protein